MSEENKEFNEVMEEEGKTPGVIVGDGEGNLPAESGGKAAVHVMAGLSFTLLKVDFTAGFEKDENGYQILLLPTDNDENQGLSIKEMIDEVKKLMEKSGAEIDAGKMQDDIEGAVNGVSDPDGQKTPEEREGFDPLALKVILRQAFLYYRKAGDSKTFEYAFSLEINMEEVMPKIDLVSLKNLSLAVWSTERKKILERMQLFHIEDILKEYA